MERGGGDDRLGSRLGSLKKNETEREGEDNEPVLTKECVKDEEKKRVEEGDGGDRLPECWRSARAPLGKVKLAWL